MYDYRSKTSSYPTLPPNPRSPHDDDSPEDQKHGVDVYAASKALEALKALEHRFKSSPQAYKQVLGILQIIRKNR